MHERIIAKAFQRSTSLSTCKQVTRIEATSFLRVKKEQEFKSNSDEKLTSPKDHLFTTYG